MGIEYFIKTCPSAGDTLADVTAWCVRKEGICCAVCPNNLATIGSRVGLIALVLFATLVVVYDGAEAPFNFLTVSMSSVAYLVAVLQAGLRGKEISKFHAYYALFSSLGFLAPLAAVSVAPNSYLYGEAHPKLNKKLLPFSRGMGRERVKKIASLAHGRPGSRHQQADSSDEQSPDAHELHSLDHLDPPRRAQTDIMNRPRVVPASNGRFGNSFWASTRSASTRAAPPRVGEHRPLTSTDPFRLGDTSNETSPVITPGSPGTKRGVSFDGEPPEVLLPGALLGLPPSQLFRSHTVSHSPPVHTPRGPNFLGSIPSSRSSTTSGSATDSDGEPSTTRTSAANSTRHAHMSLHRPREGSIYEEPEEMDEVRSLPPRPTLKLDDESTAPVTHTGANPRRRRPYPQGNAPEIRDFASDGPPGRQRTVLRKRPPAPKTRQEVEEARRHSIELTDAERAYVWERMMGRAWRRRAYIGGNFALWTLWLITFLLVAGVFPDKIFTYAQTDCEDPAGTKLLYYSILAFLCLGVLVLGVFIVNFYSHFFSHSVHRPFAYSRAHNRLTRAIVPGTFSLSIFAVWQILLWTSYEQAASEFSSLQAANEQATSFTTVLSIALAIKPFLDIVKAIVKARKLKRRQLKDAARALQKEQERDKQLERVLAATDERGRRGRRATDETSEAAGRRGSGESG